MSDRQPLLLKPDEHGIAEAARLLAGGHLVAMPTETVYGLGADARNGRAVARVYDAKGRPSFNPLIVHLPDLAAVEAIAHMPSLARDLAQAFWPGPLTLVLPLRADTGLSGLVSAGLPTVAIRVPAHPVMQAVLRAFGGPVAAPSANPSGRISPTTPDHVAAGLGGAVDAILDGGACSVGVESTILAVDGGAVRLLREGGIPREALEPMVGPLTLARTPGRVEAPGQIESHYAPHTALRMDRVLDDEDAIRVGFGPGPGPGAGCDLNLSPGGDLHEAAANLFAVLHEADRMAKQRGADHIDVAPVPQTGLGRAINDRLGRASA